MGHTSPTLDIWDENQNKYSHVSEQQERKHERRHSTSESKMDDIAHATNLATETKTHPTKLSWLKPVKVLLSPSNPYEEFHRLFKGISKDEFPINDYSCALSRDILLHGRLFVSQNWFCFYSNIFGFETLVMLECTKIKSITRAKTAYMFPNAILVRTEKKKYLFCSFLTRDAAYKLLSTVWQQSAKNEKSESGVDAILDDQDQAEEVGENSGDGEQDEESTLEDVCDLDDNQNTPVKPTLRHSKGLEWEIKHHRSISCPNTPLSRAPTANEAVKRDFFSSEHCESHKKEEPSPRKGTIPSYLRKYSNAIIQCILASSNSLYNLGSSLTLLFKRNYCSADVFLLISTLLVVILLMTTFTLMNRIARLEKRFQYTLEEFPEQHQITGQQSFEHWKNIFKSQEARFRFKTERLNQGLAVLLLSIENVKTELKSITDEFNRPVAAEQSG